MGLILCAQKDEAVARYALEGLPNKVMAAEYRTTLPDEKVLAAEIDRTRQVINLRGRPLRAVLKLGRAKLTVENPKQRAAGQTKRERAGTGKGKRK